MDIPFSSSGALSRAHYALVRKVESAASPFEADQYLLAEVETMRDRLLRSTSTVKQTKECLVTLLYCSMNCIGPLPDVEFALLHALNLAEVGQKVQDKRIGYVYCVEMMPNGHELQLMLINTIRKDLESPDVARICLALDVLIQDPSEEVIPAVRERLQDLLSHNSIHVRRRALLAFRALGIHEPSVLSDVIQKMRQRLEDPDVTVCSAALTVSVRLLEGGLLSSDKLRPVVLKLLQSTWKARDDGSKHWLLIKVLQVLRVVKPCIKAVLLILEILAACSQYQYANVITYQCFQVLSNTDSTLILEAQSSVGTTVVERIRHFLVSDDGNDVYLFISCLDCLKTSIWAGTTPEIPSALEAWEVERVMQLLDSPDATIRKRTLKVVQKIDVNIIEAYFTQMLQASSTLPGHREQEEAAQRLLEVANLVSADSGETYAQYLKKIVSVVEAAVRDTKPHIVQSAVEDVLTNLHDASVDFRGGFLGVLTVMLSDDVIEEAPGPTMTAILSAVLCEHLDLCPSSPSQILRGLSILLPRHSAAIQDAVLLAMLRVAAKCDQIPDNVLGIVGKIQEAGGRHIKRRCDQFIRLSQSKSALHAITSRAKTFSMPDFVIALESYEANPNGDQDTATPVEPAGSPDRPSSRASSRASHTAGKLRYTAYEAPKATSRLRPHRATSNSHSAAHSDSGSSRFLGQGSDAGDPISRTITAGDLALATGHIEMQDLARPMPERQTSPSRALQSLTVKEEENVSAADLIALDSPFISDPPAESQASSVSELDFETAWNNLKHANLRGWCDSPIDVVVRRLQGMQLKMRVTPADQTPFKGDLKILIPADATNLSSVDGVAVLRLREGEEESCLWNLRCEDGDLRASIRTLLTDA